MSAGRITVIYDDRCAFCVAQMRWLARLDWFDAVRLVPRSQAEAGAAVPGLNPEALAEAIHCVTPDGQVFRAARCLRRVGLRLPLTSPLALALWIPGTLWVAELVYRWIARHRYSMGAR